MTIPSRNQIELIAREAGSLIMSFRSRNQPNTVKNKSDGTPVSLADQQANFQIRQRLSELTTFPITSEEDEGAGNESNIKSYWSIDPLDGTRDFLVGLPSFTVNIALVYESMPIIGVIYAPATGDMFSAYDGLFYKNDQLCSSKKNLGPQVALVSQFHCDPDTMTTLQQLGIQSTKAVGSSLKFAMLADGSADVYLRKTPFYIWDVAAGQAIITAAGFHLMCLKTKAPICYDNPRALVQGVFATKDLGLFEKMKSLC